MTRRWFPPSGRDIAAGSLPATAAISALAAAMALGCRSQQLADVRLDRRVQLVRRHDRVDQSDLARARGRKTRRRSGTARGRPTARSSRPRMAKSPPAGSRACLGESEHRIVGGHDDVADRGKAGAAAERRAMDPADQRHRQSYRAPRTSARQPGRRGCSLPRSRRPSSTSSEVGAGAEDLPRAATGRRHGHRAPAGPLRPTPSARRSVSR